MNQSEKWRIDDSKDAAWRCWGGEIVVYCGASAETHLLSPDASAVFAALDERSSSLSLQEISARAFGGQRSDAASIRQVLLEFERIGLVRRATS